MAEAKLDGVRLVHQVLDAPTMSFSFEVDAGMVRLYSGMAPNPLLIHLVDLSAAACFRFMGLPGEAPELARKDVIFLESSQSLRYVTEIDVLKSTSGLVYFEIYLYDMDNSFLCKAGFYNTKTQ